MTFKITLLILISVSVCQLSFGQQGVSRTKTNLIEKLFTQTSGMLPFEAAGTEIRLRLKNDIEASGMTYLTDPILKGIETDPGIPEQRKAAIRKKFPELLKKLNALILEISLDGFDFALLYRKSFRIEMSNALSVSEIRKLAAYFATKNGREFVKNFSEASMAGYKAKIPHGENEKLKIAATSQSPLTKKFVNLLLIEVSNGVREAMADAAGKTSIESEQEKLSKPVAKLVEEFLKETEQK